MQLPETLKAMKHAVDLALTHLLQHRYAGPDPLSCAVRYALEGEGKRVRPLLCLLTAQACGARPTDLEEAMPAALALEMVHTYSLVHDDLPIMDNDDLRRGRATVHKVYGDAEALLAGDALLTDAFGILTDPETYLGQKKRLPAATVVPMVAELARAAGGEGMVLGQSQDLYWTGRSGAQAVHLNSIHLRKTGRLLGASSALGAMTRGASPSQIDAYRTFGEQLGLAFQITDDLLDDSTGTGKSAGKDLASGKLTYLSFMSRDEATHAADATTQKALTALESTGIATRELAAFAGMLLNRKT